jgi:AraC-like DNA-binding protein
MQASARILQNFATALAVLGFNPDAVLARASLTLAEVQNGNVDEQRVPLEALGRFWAATVAVTGDPAIGVRIGALARIDNYGVLGRVARASATLGDALLKTVRYMNLLIETASLSVLVDCDRVQVIYSSLRAPPAAADAALAQLLVLSRELTGRRLVPEQVRFAHRAPPDDSFYREVFGIAPTFDDLEHSLVVAADCLILPITTHDSRESELLVAEAKRLADAVSSDDSVSRRVRDVLARELQGGNPMVENVAAQLGMHPKALMRRLKQEGTSHSALLDSLRREHAEQYLRMPRLNVAEAAFLLGFSDASAFIKAFRRWFGVAPLEFRRRAMQAKNSRPAPP